MSKHCGGRILIDAVPQNYEALQVELDMFDNPTVVLCENDHKRPHDRHRAWVNGTTYTWAVGSLWIHADPEKKLG